MGDILEFKRPEKKRHKEPDASARCIDQARECYDVVERLNLLNHDGPPKEVPMENPVE